MIGAALVCLILYLVNSRSHVNAIDTTPPLSSTSSNDEAMMQVENETAAANISQSPALDLVETSIAKQTPKTQGPTLPESMWDLQAAHEVQELTEQLVDIVAGDMVRLEELAGLALLKIQKDYAVQAHHSLDSLTEEQLKIAKTADTELSPEQIEEKYSVYQQLEQVRDALEENRIDYEVALKGLLNDRELREYQNREQAIVIEDFNAQTNMLNVSLRVAVTNLNDQQVSEIDRISAQYTSREFTSIPVGSTLGQSTGTSSGSNHTQAMMENYTADVLALLTPEQLKAYQSSPLNFFR